MRRKFEVALNMPEGMKCKEVAAYIQRAVDNWRGGGDPEDPIYDADLDLRVRPIPIPR